MTTYSTRSGVDNISLKSVDLFKKDDGNTEGSEEAPVVDDDIAISGGGGGATHSIGGLTCSKYGGPSEEIASEMIYWQDIPSDATFKSPFHKKATSGESVQYLTFEPDGGGWNNIR